MLLVLRDQPHLPPCEVNLVDEVFFGNSVALLQVVLCFGSGAQTGSSTRRSLTTSRDFRTLTRSFTSVEMVVRMSVKVFCVTGNSPTSVEELTLTAFALKRLKSCLLQCLGASG